MIDLRFRVIRRPAVLALPVSSAGRGEPDDDSDDDARTPTIDPGLDPAWGLDPDTVDAFIADLVRRGPAASVAKAGKVHTLPRPGQVPNRVLLVGVGKGAEADWRAAGAALARSCRRDPGVAVAVPDEPDPDALRGFAEGLWLASYRYRLGADKADDAARLRRVTLLRAATPADQAVLDSTRRTVEMVRLARDLTNTPSDTKTPEWFAKQVGTAAAKVGATVTVREPAQLTAEGFGGVLAVGSGSTRGPRLVEVSWRPRGARATIVLVGKGITFDTGGICVKTREGMKLMRKDMGGAAAVVCAVLGAAALNLPVRLTALAPLAENLLSGTAMRPGDVVRHYGGLTTEIRNTDAEGRLVLADALSYAARRLRPDVIVDLATLTGAQSVSLGKRTAALYSGSDALAGALTDAGKAVGEQMWRMPLHDDYAEALEGEVTDVVNHTPIGAGSVMAALYLREFVGPLRDRWAHLDMSAPAWSDKSDGELVKGATGWGVRTLLRWLADVAADPESLSAVAAAR